MPEATDTEQLEGKKDLLRGLGICVLLVIVVRSFVFEPFKIPSSSMVPTLKIGDHIFVSKFSYGLSLPFTKIFVAKWGEPKRGDVIVFLYPKDESLHYIKRVVGVPGDKIQFKGKDIYINGELVPKTEVTDPKTIDSVTGSQVTVGKLYREDLAGVSHFVKYSSNAVFDFSGTPIEEVPKDHFFVMGDNRDDSYDSRSWGFVPRENIKGRALMIWLSIDQEQSVGVPRFRWGRFGMLIH